MFIPFTGCVLLLTHASCIETFQHHSTSFGIPFIVLHVYEYWFFGDSDFVEETVISKKDGCRGVPFAWLCISEVDFPQMFTAQGPLIQFQICSAY